MEQSSAPPARPTGSHDVQAFNAFSWRERHEVEEPGYGQASSQAQSFGQVLSSLPDWAVISGGGLVAAILGAMVGGALHI